MGLRHRKKLKPRTACSMSLADDYSSDDEDTVPIELFINLGYGAGKGAAAEQARMADRRLANREGRSFVDTHSKVRIS